MAQSLTKPIYGATTSKQAWLRSPVWDCTFIFGPAFVSSALVLLFRAQIEECPELPLWAWVSFVLCIDVAHVYATLFRTYFNKKSFEANRSLLTIIPLACWIVGAMLYSIKGILFWRVLAYLAVFHFVRQQFGFLMLYSRKDSGIDKFGLWLEHAVIYMAAIYPLLFWHTNLPRNFSWFVDGDFLSGLPAQIGAAGLIVYTLIAVAYAAKEMVRFWRHHEFNLPKNLVVAGTALSWWVGIIAVNSDLAFTATNVVSHGVPYVALVWLYHHKDGNENKSSARTGHQFWNGLWAAVLSNAVLMCLFLVSLAYIEEGLWAGLVWREHLSVFSICEQLPVVTDRTWLAFLVPLLALPQSAHYVLDGFIWRVKGGGNSWSIAN